MGAQVGPRLGWARREVVALDRRVSRRIARAPGRSPLGPGHLMGRRNALPTWGLFAAGLIALGPRGRQAARRGLVAATASSVLGDRLLKPAIGRPRPEGARRASASFPSGHACTGSAFATAVACEWPAAGAVAIATSALVSTGRVRDGEHHLLDIVSGTAFGIAVALVARTIEDRVVPAPPNWRPDPRSPQEI
jgi:membrane-associated phospholipid phosphatase